MKECYKCHLSKQLSEFHKDINKKDGHVGVCKLCASKRVRAWAKKNPDKIKLQQTKHRFSRYGITKQIFEDLLKKQNNLCAVCSEADPNNIDHDHKCCPPNKRACGKCIRGILCNNCNLALGHIKDKIEVVEKLLNYLKQPGLV